MYKKILLQHCRNNISKIKEYTPNKNIYAVVKTDAYGHGLVEVSKVLQTDVEGFCVSTIYEAIQLRENGIDKDILLFLHKHDDWPHMHKYHLTMVLYDCNKENLKKLINFISSKPFKIHLKINTGMNRLGMKLEDIAQHIDLLKQLTPYIEGIMTHLSVDYNTNPEFYNKQLTAFNKTIHLLRYYQIVPIKIHYISSNHLFSQSQQQQTQIEDNFIRCGEYLYGLGKTDLFQPCVEIVTQIIQIQKVDAKQYVGYNNTYVTEKQIQIATILGGYGDGLHSSWSNCSYVRINHKYYSIVGKCSMNYMSVAIDNNDFVSLDDPVYLISADPNSLISLENVSKRLSLPPYEVICMFHNWKKVYV